MEALAWSLRVAATAPDAATVYARRHRLEVGPALAFDSEAPRVSALEQVLGAIGADLVTGFLKRARRRRLEIDGVEALVEGRLGNPLVWLDVVGEEGDPGLIALSVRVYVGTPADTAAVEAVWQETLARSPLVRTFRRALDLQLTLIAKP